MLFVERAAYELLSSKIVIIFQPKAWADGAVCLSWLDHFEAETGALGERLLGMDQHGAQMTRAFLALMNTNNIEAVYTPTNCTDVVAPIDHHVGAALKRIIGKLYHAALEANKDQWCNPPGQGGLEAWERRVFIASWIVQAWDIMQVEYVHLLRSAFVSTGFLLPIDGSENNLIKVPGVSDYDFTKLYT